MHVILIAVSMHTKLVYCFRLSFFNLITQDIAIHNKDLIIKLLVYRTQWCKKYELQKCTTMLNFCKLGQYGHAQSNTYISHNIITWALVVCLIYTPFALQLLGFGVVIYQANHSCPYNYYIYYNFSKLHFVVMCTLACILRLDFQFY